jgi:DNA-binding transcriptional ArsR family regulator
MARSLTPHLDRALTELAQCAHDGTLGLSADELDAVVTEKALREEATRDRAGLLEAAEALHELAAWVGGDGDEAGRRLQARWEMLGEHLTDRASRSDSIGVEALLRSHGCKPRRLLELLAATTDGSLARSEIAAPLAASESHVSHILRALHDADLVFRHQEGREVTVTISARGRALADPDRPTAGSSAPALPDEVARLVVELPPHRRARLQRPNTLAPVLDALA